MNNDLRDLQFCSLKILKEIKRVCEKNEITYFLSSGTLLGAIRHKGFIPWDDDIDICMPVEDYKKFIEACKTDLSSEFFLQSHETDTHFSRSYLRIRLNGTTMMPPQHKKHKIHHGIWVDVLPLVDSTGKYTHKLKKACISLSNYFQMDSFIVDNEDEFIGIMGKPRFAVFKCFLKLPLKFRIKLHNALLKYVFHKSKKCSSMSEVWTSLTKRLPKEIFDEVIYVEFENELFPSPKKYDEYLTIYYGDYMKLPPVEQQIGHGDGNLIIDLNKDYKAYIEE